MKVEFKKEEAEDIRETEEQRIAMETKVSGRIQELEAKMKETNKRPQTQVVRNDMRNDLFDTNKFSYKIYNIVNILSSKSKSCRAMNNHRSLVLFLI